MSKNQTNKKEIFSTFNKSYFNFLLFIKKNMGNDAKFNTFYFKNLIIKETNIKLFIKPVASSKCKDIIFSYFTEFINLFINFWIVGIKFSFKTLHCQSHWG